MSKQQFTLTYEQAIALIKIFKSSNDQLNKSIGVDRQSTILLKLKSEQPSHHDMTRKIDALILKLEQSYLDPDTARKIGTAKQQYRIQRDRRSQLIQSVQLEDRKNGSSSNSSSFNTTIDSFDLGKSKEQFESKVKSSSNQNYNNRNSTSNQRNMIEMMKEQQDSVTDYDYEMEYKLMREKSKSLTEVTKTLINVQSLINETGGMVHSQGQQLDIIGDQLFTTYQNTKQAKEQLVEANQYQKKSKSKYIFLSVVAVVATVILLVIFVL